MSYLSLYRVTAITMDKTCCETVCQRLSRTNHFCERVWQNFRGTSHFCLFQNESNFIFRVKNRAENVGWLAVWLSALNNIPSEPGHAVRQIPLFYFHCLTKRGSPVEGELTVSEWFWSTLIWLCPSIPFYRRKSCTKVMPLFK